MNFDILREVAEFRGQLSSDKRRLAFFFGAGTSQAVGIPGLLALTDLVRNELHNSEAEHFARFLTEDGPGGNVETVLNRVRLCREILGDTETRRVEGLSGLEAAALDRGICQAIRKHVTINPPGGLRRHFIFAHWLKTITRSFPLELFTTNYDLLFETAMESAETPYFDGFVGTVSPFFRATSIDTDFGGVPLPTVPRDWVRLWKLHGSINWLSIRDPLTGSSRIVRRSDRTVDPATELMVYPSRQKYSDSRRLPFTAYQDRLRRLLASGETLLVIVGYSFADEHLNEIIFQSLRSNPRLAVTALSFAPLDSVPTRQNLMQPTDGIPSLTIYAPDGAVIGGTLGGWTPPAEKPPSGLASWPFWDETKKICTLPDFNGFVDFLRSFLASRSIPELS